MLKSPAMRRAFRLVAGLPAVLLAGGCAHGTTSASAPPPPAHATVRPHRTPTVTPAPTPTPTATPRAVASPNTMPQATPSPVRTPSGVPQILSIRLDPSQVSAGSTIHAYVHTTTQVVAVTAIAAGQSIPVPQVSLGVFATSTTLPPMLPPFVHGPVVVTFVARDARGRTTQAATDITLR
jgi:hypothetical protein